MRIGEKAVIGIILGAIYPVLGFLAVWWATFAFLPDRLVFAVAALGFLAGVLVDVVYLRRWVNSAHSISLKLWIAVYLFYSVGVFGFFMGVPVFNLLLGVPAGFVAGSRLVHQQASYEDVRRLRRQACAFTTCVLALACALSAALALMDPYTSSNLKGMFGLPFEVTSAMIVGIIVVGGAALLFLQWGITALAIRLKMRWLTPGPGNQAVHKGLG